VNPTEMITSISDRIEAELERLQPIRQTLRITRGDRSRAAGISREALKHPFLKSTQLAGRIANLEIAIHDLRPRADAALREFIEHAVELEAMKDELGQLKAHQERNEQERSERLNSGFDEDQRGLLYDLREIGVTKGHLAARTPALTEQIAELLRANHEVISATVNADPQVRAWQGKHKTWDKA
jgi:hypothetical protein